MAIERCSRPRILVVGAGAIGCLLGGTLSSRGCDVTMLTRTPADLSIASRGLDIRGRAYSGTVYPQATLDAHELRYTPDVVLLTVKAFDAIPALDGLPTSILNQSTFVSFQNGMGTEEEIVARHPDLKLVAGSLTLAAQRQENGRVVSTSRSGGVALAKVSNEPALEPLLRVLGTIGVPVRTFRDFRSMKWSKLVLNLMGNATSAILGWSPARIYADPQVVALELVMLREAFSVLRAQRLSPVWLPGFPVPLLEWGLSLPPLVSGAILKSLMSRGRGGQMPSLYRDIEAGRSQTEAHWLYGQVIRAGRELNLPVEVNRRLYRVLSGISADEQLRHAFRDSPCLLLRNVQVATSRF